MGATIGGISRSSHVSQPAIRRILRQSGKTNYTTAVAVLAAVKKLSEDKNSAA
jgi:hypothetical protein